jgi:hypothetical protein
MMRCDHLASSKIEALVTVVIRQVAKEGTRYRTCAKHVHRSGHRVGEAEAAKDADVIVCRWQTK